MVCSTVVLAGFLASRVACCCLPLDALVACTVVSLRRLAWASSLVRWAAARASVTCLEDCFACDEAIVFSLFLFARERTTARRGKGEAGCRLPTEAVRCKDCEAGCR